LNDRCRSRSGSCPSSLLLNALLLNALKRFALLLGTGLTGGSVDWLGCLLVSLRHNL
jgi:hypothetical protein